MMHPAHRCKVRSTNKNSHGTHASSWAESPFDEETEADALSAALAIAGDYAKVPGRSQALKPFEAFYSGDRSALFMVPEGGAI